MKRIFCIAIAALAITLASHQQASAWHKCTFGIGMNVSCEGGGNTLLWGVWRGGPAPCQGDGCGYGYGGKHGFGGGYFGGPYADAGMGMPAYAGDPTFQGGQVMPTSMPQQPM